jgi:hypothetical protein
MSLKTKRSEVVLHLTLDGHQHGPLATSLQGTHRFAIPLGHQTPMADSRLTPLPLLTTVLPHTVHHLLTSTATRLLDTLQLGRPLIPAHNLSQQV